MGTLHAISDDNVFKEYLDSGKYKMEMEEYFLSIKKSNPYISQIRYISNNGMEKIKVEELDHPFENKVISRIVEESELQTKKLKEYESSFLNLKKDEIGISQIDLNLNNGKWTLLNEPTIRLGKLVYDVNDQ